MNVLATIYDDARLKHHERHVLLFLVHLLSWERAIGNQYPLRVICVGEPKPMIRDAIERCGAHIEVRQERHSLFESGPCYNKHLAKPEDASNERVFLTDNDTVYLSSSAPLFEYPKEKVLVSLAPKSRVSAEMWSLLLREMGARPVELEWTPRWRNPREPAEIVFRGKEQYGYFNGGAILFPNNSEFWDIWERKSFELTEFLENKGMDGQKTVGTDQCSLALAIGEYGKWDFLPDGFNYMYVDYWLGRVKPEAARHLHIAGIGRQYGELTPKERMSASLLIGRFWESRVINGMKDCGMSERDIDGAIAHRDFILQIIKDNDLEDLRQYSCVGSYPKVGVQDVTPTRRAWKLYSRTLKRISNLQASIGKWIATLTSGG